MGRNFIKRFIVNGRFAVTLGLVLLISGGASHYYKVKGDEPQSGSVYYTKEIDSVEVAQQSSRMPVHAAQSQFRIQK